MSIDYRNKPYVYRLTHKETGEFYIGYRMANVAPAELDFGVEYTTSSDVIKNMGFINFDPLILCECYHEDRKIAADNAYDIEQEMIAHEFNDPLCLNGHYKLHDGRKRFRCTGHTKESKDKMRSGNLGKIHSDESRSKMSVARLGTYQTESHRINKNIALTGKIRTEESRVRMSLSQLGKVLSEETKSKMSISQIGNTNALGKSHSYETKAKMSESRLGKVQSEETKAKRAKSLAIYRQNKKQLIQTTKENA